MSELMKEGRICFLNANASLGLILKAVLVVVLSVLESRRVKSQPPPKNPTFHFCRFSRSSSSFHLTFYQTDYHGLSSSLLGLDRARFGTAGGCQRHIHNFKSFAFQKALV